MSVGTEQQCGSDPANSNKLVIIDQASINHPAIAIHPHNKILHGLWSQLGIDFLSQI